MSEFNYVDGYEIYEDYKDCRTIEITNKCIGDMSDQVVIAGEVNSQYIRFEVGRYENGIDLSDKAFHIHYARANGKGDESTPVNVQCNDKLLKFGWIVPREAALSAGKVSIMIWCAGTNSKDRDFLWKTKTRTFAVQEGAIIGSGIAEPDEEWYLDFVRKMDALLENATREIRDVTEECQTVTQSANELIADMETRLADGGFSGIDTSALDNLNTMFDFVMNSLSGITTIVKIKTDLKYSNEGGYTAATGNSDGTRTIVATTRDGYVFAGWYTEKDVERLSSQEETLLANVSSTPTITAKFVSEGNYSIITYISTGHVIAAIIVPGGAENIPYPASNPYSYGRTFTGWDMEEEDILAALKSGDITVNAVFEKMIVYYLVKVIGGQVFEDEEPAQVSGEYEALTLVTVTADQPEEGKQFSHWADGSGNIMSYKSTYKFYLTKDIDLTAVFVSEDTEIEKAVLIQITNITIDSDTNKMSFTAERAIPTDVTLVQHGIILTSDTTLNEDTFIIGASGVLKGTSTSASKTGTYVLTKSSVYVGDTWFARGYVVYKDTEGIEHTVYTDIVSKTRE